jgi:hypothetical protein
MARNDVVNSDGSLNIDKLGQNVDDIKNHTAQLAETVKSFDITETVTVGTGGDYATINEAITYLSKKYPKYINGNYNNRIKAEISLLTGFTMNEEVHISGLNLGWITLTSVDVEVVVLRDNIITMLPSEVPSVFYVERGILPVIGCLFSLSDTGTTAQRDGIVANDGGHATILPNCGFKKATRTNVFARNNSTINMESGIATYAGSYGVHAVTGSSIYAWYADASYAALRHGFRARRGAKILAMNAKADNVGGSGFYASYGSFVQAGGGSALNAGENGIYADFGGIVEADGANVTGATSHGISCQNGSTVTAPRSFINGVGAYGVLARYNATVNVSSAEIKDAGNAAIYAEDASHVNASSVIATGAINYGAHANRGSNINLHGANVQKGATTAAADMFIERGSIINASLATGGNSHTTNTLHPAGIIFR